jgi:hypothetical protein
MVLEDMVHQQSVLACLLRYEIDGILLIGGNGAGGEIMANEVFGIEVGCAGEGSCGTQGYGGN